MPKTIEAQVSYEGTSLHSGVRTTITFKPASAGEGIKFVRTDLPERPSIKASLEYVSNSNREISLKNEHAEVRVVEHLLAALSGLEIDNITIEIDSDEVPAGDGSSLPFVKILKEAKIKNLGEERDFIKIKTPISVGEDQRTISILPDSQLKITYTIEFPHPVVKTQTATFVIDEQTFIEEIAPARTFGFLSEVKNLRQKGLIKGGSLDNAIVIGDDKILNEDLRFEDELVRHKILDLIGDFTLIGKPLKGHIIAVKAGHELNLKLARMIAELDASKPNPMNEPIIDINQIKEILPHRYPFLLVDRIVEFEKGKRIVGIKNVTINEEFFQGHFPQYPIMPGVLIIEAMAQTAGVFILSERNLKGEIVYFVGMDNVKFRKPVLPGDQLRFEITPIKLRQTFGKVQGKAYVDEKLVAEAELTFSFPNKNKKEGSL
jgi:UDP-3-O-[3-hydroxymyristoyl] N-acetylglucosamine deacetylase/3-hydroxyacyl-[acyl-carrier-protein] dehydratase